MHGSASYELETCSARPWMSCVCPRAAASPAGAASARACCRCRSPRTRTAPSLGARALTSWSSARGACAASGVDASVVNQFVGASTPPRVPVLAVVEGVVRTVATHMVSQRLHRPATHIPPLPMPAQIISLTTVALAPKSTVLPELLLACSRPTAPPGLGGGTPLSLHCVALARLRPG